MTRYCPISLERFTRWTNSWGFYEVDVPGTNEYVFERIIHNGPNPYRFKVQILSSVSKLTNLTREVGADAIRIMLIDTKLSRAVQDWRVFRTANAQTNAHERAKEAWAYVMAADHHCPDCGALMVRRTSKNGSFMGCTAYPVCKTTKNIEAKAA